VAHRAKVFASAERLFALVLVSLVLVMSVVWVFVPLAVALRSGGGRIVGEELLAAVFTAKIESMPVPIGAQGRRFIHHHSANWVFGHSPPFPSIVRYLWSLKGIHSPGRSWRAL